MIDPEFEILTAFETALSSITYEGVTWHVYKDTPPKGKQNYIFFSELSTGDESAKDNELVDGTLIIEISVKKDKYCKLIANSLSDSILQAVEDVKLSMTSYDMIVDSIANDVALTREEKKQNYIKTLRLNFKIQEK